MAYFFLNCFRLLNAQGVFGLLQLTQFLRRYTEVGLETILREGGQIFSAYTNEPWPGDANVVTSRVHVVKGNGEARHFKFTTSGKISALLSDQIEIKPQRLQLNQGQVFQGSIPVGNGLFFDERR